MNKQIFIINGSGGVGKDLFVKIVKEILDKQSQLFPTVINFSSVDKVKEIAKIIGWNGSKNEKDRKFLSDLKLLTTDYNDMPFESLKAKVHYFNHSLAQLLFLHIREPQEIDRAKQEFNAKTVLVKRDSVEQIISNMADANVYNYNYDFVIENNGSIEDLKETARKFLLQIGGLQNEEKM